MASDDSELARAVGLALTGERLALNSVDTLERDLALAGHDRQRLAESRAQRRAAHLPWPFPVPIDQRRQLGFARFDAALADARRRLGLTGLQPARPAVRALDGDERRLMADRPPHW